jgi:hypothetical protein
VTACTVPESLVDAIRRSWTRDTASQPDRWRPDVPETGHCDVTSLVVWEHVGGDLVLAQVFVDGAPSEHDWNRVDGVDIDLTRDQFVGHEDGREVAITSGDEIRARKSSVRLELAARLHTFQARVAAELRHWCAITRRATPYIHSNASSPAGIRRSAATS